jgi:spermidine synthase
MKFCVDYQRHFKYDKEIDEFTIYYRREDTTLIEFLLKYQDKRINISVSDAEMFLFEKDIERFDAIVKEYPDLNIYFKLRTYNDSFNKELFELLKEHGFKVFFGEFIIDYDSLNGNPLGRTLPHLKNSGFAQKM